MAEKPPSSMARYAVWYVLALIMLLSVFQYYSAVQQAVEISYSEFRHLVQIKGVDDLTVSTRHHHRDPFAPRASTPWPKSGKNPTCPRPWPSNLTRKSPPSPP